jgi:multiple antibiotic resistance protein
LLFWTCFLLAFTSLLPLINPLGSALIFTDLVGNEPVSVYKSLAGKIALSTFVFLLVIEYLGSVVLGFFGLTLPVVQIAGGLVMAATAWRLLFEKDADAEASSNKKEVVPSNSDLSRFTGGIFYPYTFPITAGPGSLVTMLTLTAHVSSYPLAGKALAHGGYALAAIVLSAAVFFCYGYAPRILQTVSVPTVHGVLRVISFLLLCIGTQLVCGGIATFVTNFLHMVKI